MKKLLLFVLGLSAFAGAAQNTCATALPLPTGMSAVGDINGTYITGCWTGTVPTAAEWYTYTPTSRGVLRINTNLPTNDGVLQSDDTRISVFTGTCAALTCYTALDDVDDTNYLTDLEFVVDGGVTYYIEFDNRWTPAPFDVDVTFTAASCGNDPVYDGDFDTLVDYACWRSFNTNGDAVQWGFNGVNDFDGDGIDDGAAMIFPQAATNAAKDEWLISKALALTAGVQYTVKVHYNGFNSPVAANEAFTTVMMDAPNPTSFVQTIIGTATNIVQTGTFGQPTFITSAPQVSYTYTPTVSGDYYVGLHAVTANPGGILIIFSVDVEVPLSVGENDTNSFAVYPNPASDMVSISSAAAINTVSITDLNGRTVKALNLNGVINPDVNISDLSAGMYMLTIGSDSGSVTKKIVKK